MKFKVGDKVLVRAMDCVALPFQSVEGIEGVIVDEPNSTEPLVDFGPDYVGEGHGTSGSCQWVRSSQMTLIEEPDTSTAKKAKKSAVRVDKSGKPVLSAQASAVLGLLQAKGSVTSLEAAGVYRVRSLSRRICDLKEAGYKITRSISKDTTGQRYARYYLSAA